MNCIPERSFVIALWGRHTATCKYVKKRAKSCTCGLQAERWKYSAAKRQLSNIRLKRNQRDRVRAKGICPRCVKNVAPPGKICCQCFVSMIVQRRHVAA